MIFVHQPRTGGTSVEMALFGRPIYKESQHWSAARWKQENPTLWERELTISVVRHPVYWCQSLYLTHERSEGLPFDEWVASGGRFSGAEATMTLSQKRNTEGCKEIMRTESLAVDILKLTARHKICLIQDLPRANVYLKAKPEIAKHERDMIEEVCAEDFEEFGY